MEQFVPDSKNLQATQILPALLSQGSEILILSAPLIVHGIIYMFPELLLRSRILQVFMEQGMGDKVQQLSALVIYLLIQLQVHLILIIR